MTGRVSFISWVVLLGLVFTAASAWSVGPGVGNQKLWLSAHGGVTFPLGPYADYFYPSYNYMFDFGYRIKAWNFSSYTFAGYSHFREKPGCWPDFYIINFNTNVRYSHRLGGPVYVYGAFGPGYYFFKHSVRNTFGVNLGAGFDIGISPSLAFEVGGDWHRLGGPTNMSFSHAHAGLLWLAF